MASLLPRERGNKAADGSCTCGGSCGACAAKVEAGSTNEALLAASTSLVDRCPPAEDLTPSSNIPLLLNPYGGWLIGERLTPEGNIGQRPEGTCGAGHEERGQHEETLSPRQVLRPAPPELGWNQLIFPSALGVVSLDRPMGLGFLEALRRRSGEVTAARTAGALDGPRPEWLRPDRSHRDALTPPRPGERAGPKGETLRPAMLGPVAGVGPIGAGHLDLTPMYVFSYRSVSFMVERDWLGSIAADMCDFLDSDGDPNETFGVLPSVNDTLKYVWNDYLKAAEASGVDDEDFKDIVGCYNLARETAVDDPDVGQYLALRSGWGAPWFVHQHTCRLLYSYSKGIEDVYSQNPWCEGLKDFIERQLLNKQATQATSSGGRCVTRIHYINEDTAYAKTVDGEDWFFHPCAYDSDSGMKQFTYIDVATYAAGVYERDERAFPCDAGFRHNHSGHDGCQAEAWNHWHPVSAYNTTGGSYVWTMASGSDRVYPPGGPNCDVYALGSDEWHIHFMPAHLAFDGYVVDELIGIARLAHAYILDRYIESLSAGDPQLTARVASAAEAAKGFGGLALRIIARRGQLLAHEMGHVFLGGSPHCDPDTWRNCFEQASQFWLCRVKSKLGLPQDAYVGIGVTTSNYKGTTEDDWYGYRYFSMGNSEYLVSGTCETGGGKDSSSTDPLDTGENKCRSAYSCTIHDPAMLGSNYTFCATNGCICLDSMKTDQCIKFWTPGSMGAMAGCVTSNR